MTIPKITCTWLTMSTRTSMKNLTLRLTSARNLTTIFLVVYEEFVSNSKCHQFHPECPLSTLQISQRSQVSHDWNAKTLNREERPPSSLVVKPYTRFKWKWPKKLLALCLDDKSFIWNFTQKRIVLKFPTTFMNLNVNYPHGKNLIIRWNCPVRTSVIKVLRT
mgnify:CR=1 FL=1